MNGISEMRAAKKIVWFQNYRANIRDNFYKPRNAERKPCHIHREKAKEPDIFVDCFSTSTFWPASSQNLPQHMCAFRQQHLHHHLRKRFLLNRQPQMTEKVKYNSWIQGTIPFIILFILFETFWCSTKFSFYYKRNEASLLLIKDGIYELPNDIRLIGYQSNCPLEYILLAFTGFFHINPNKPLLNIINLTVI